MRRPLPLVWIALSSAPLVAGCVSLARAGAPVHDAPASIELVITVPEEGASFTREETLTLLDDGRGNAIRFEVRSTFEQRRLGADRVLEHVDYERLVHHRDGARQPLEGRMHGLERVEVRTLRDRHGAVLEGPEVTGQPGVAAELASAVLAALRLCRVQFAEGEVRVGERWGVPPIEWDSPPSRRVGLVVEPTWTLARFERDADDHLVARIDWDAAFHVRPFAALAGTTLEGRGHLRGTSRVRVEDGTSARTELDIELSIGPSGAAELVALFRFEGKYTSLVRPRPTRPQGLRAPVRLR